jgi:hypothetical protein
MRVSLRWTWSQRWLTCVREVKAWEWSSTAIARLSVVEAGVDVILWVLTLVVTVAGPIWDVTVIGRDAQSINYERKVVRCCSGSAGLVPVLDSGRAIGRSLHELQLPSCWNE